jgi:Flp pilus assembly protein TadG
VRRHDERGSLAPAVPIIAMFLLLLGGLVIDASRQLNARGEAVAFAEEAARAGAQGVDVASEDLVLDRSLAQARVERYCRRVLQLGQVVECSFQGVDSVSATDPRPLVVRTRVRTKIETSLLGLAGVHSLTATGEAKARPYEGIDEAIEP